MELGSKACRQETTLFFDGRAHFRTLTALLVLLLGCGDDDGSVDTDARVRDASDAAADTRVNDVGSADRGVEDRGVEDRGVMPPSDGGSDASDVAVDTADDMGTTRCGDGRVDVSQIRGTEGLAIAPDGTLFFSQSGGVGRVRSDGTIEADWLTGLPRTVWGLGYRALDDTLFVATPGEGGIVYSVDGLADDPSANVLVRGLGALNGLIVLDDGSLIVSAFDMGRIYRVSDVDTFTRINADMIRAPNGLLLDDDGALLVLSYFSGEVVRLELDDAFAEVSRSTLVTIRANPDGIGKDEEGRYYITDNGAGRLLRFNGAFEEQELLLSEVPTAANIAFGAGALSCTDLYVTSGAQMQVIDVGAVGRP